MSRALELLTSVENPQPRQKAHKSVIDFTAHLAEPILNAAPLITSQNEGERQRDNAEEQQVIWARVKGFPPWPVSYHGCYRNADD